MNHYYTDNQNLPSNEQEKIINIKNTTLKILTDNGVFAKKGLDYGTKTLLENIKVKENSKILDLGCGVGPIGLYLKKTYNVDVDMTDVNNRSIELSKKNAIKNKVEVNVFYSDKYENINQKYDYIITNPPIRIGKTGLYEILEQAKDHLKEDGELWFVIHKDQGAKSTGLYLEKFYNISIVEKDKGFYIFCASKR